MTIKSYLFSLSSFISYLGNNLFYIVVTWLIYETAHNAFSVSIFLAVNSVTGILFGSISGTVSDRLNPKLICVCMDFLRACFLLGLGFVFQVELGNVWYIYIFAFLIAVCNNLFFPAFIALVKFDVQSEDVESVISANNIGLQIGAILGSMLAGLLLGKIGAAASLFVAGMCYLMSCGILMMLKSVKRHIDNSEDNQDSLFKSFVLGFKYAIKNQKTQVILGVVIFSNCIVNVINTLLSEYSSVGLRASSTVYGNLDATYAIGGAFGGTVLLILKKCLNLKVSFIVCNFVIGLAFLQLSILNVIPSAFLAIFIIGVSNMLVGTYASSALVSNTDEKFVGRIQSIQWILYSSVAPLIGGSTGVLASKVGILVTTMIVGSIILGVVALTILRIAVVKFS